MISASPQKLWRFYGTDFSLRTYLHAYGMWGGNIMLMQSRDQNVPVINLKIIAMLKIICV